MCLEAFNQLKKKYPNIKLHIAFGNAEEFIDNAIFIAFNH